MDLDLGIRSDLITKLRSSELCSFLSDKEFAHFLQSGQHMQLGLGDLLPESSANMLKILTSGRIRLLHRFPSGDESNICVLDLTGDTWCDFWLPPDGQSIVLARASQESQIVLIEPSICNDLATRNAKFAEHFSSMKLQWECFGFLRKMEIFHETPSAKLKAIARYLNPGTVNFQNVSPESLNGLYIIFQGDVECITGSESHTLRCGDYFIAREFGPFKASGKNFKAQSSVQVLSISEAQYDDLLNHSPELAQVIANAINASSGEARNAINASSDSFHQSPRSSPTHSVPALEPEINEDPISTRVNRLLHQYPFILQQSQMDCGITCIAMVALFYGKRLDINDLRERAGVSIEGTSFLAMADTAEHLGFMARGVSGTYEGLLNAKLPLICFWKNNHFVVLYKINKKEALIADPAEGLRTVSRQEFSECFSRSALELVPTADLKRAPGAKNPLTILLPLLKPYHSQLRDVLVAGIIYQALMIITPFFSQTIIDRVIVHEDVSMLNMLLVGLIIVSCFQAALTFARGILISTLSTKIDHALFVQFFKHLLSLPFKYFEQRSSGDVLARFNENARITAFLSGSTVTVLLDSVMAVIYLMVLFYYNWSFGLVTLVYIALLMGVVQAYTPLLRGYSNEIFKKTVANDSCVIETVHGIEKIKSAAVENRTRWKWESLFVEKLGVQFKQQLAYNGYNQVTGLVHLLGRVLLMWLGANLVISKSFTVGQYMAANMIAGMAVDPFLRLISIWQQIQSVNISVERLGDVFRAAPEQSGQKTRMPEIRGFIEFRNVTFRYNEHSGKNTLLNVSLRMQPNQMVAIVGRAGCGKTTLARLIQGLYLPTSGNVLIDDVDLSQIELSDLRKKIGVVAQQEFFFAGTVRENIAFYAPDAPLEDIINAAKQAGIHEKIMNMGSGYDTYLTEGGYNLSGGERQRLAIARAILHKPRILIFDEATSALDSESERYIQSSVEEIRKGRTLIVIAHRLSTIKSADVIVVMNQGQIVEIGNHESLLQKKGLYFNLCSQQLI